jgi:hypothetical protein
VGWELDEGDGRAIHAIHNSGAEDDWAASAVLDETKAYRES